jgi:two-component system, NarL family, response regulator DesR
MCNMGPVLSLVIADPQQLLAEGLAILLDAEDDFAVLGVAHDGRKALELTAEHQPAVLLLGAPLAGSALTATPTAVKAVSPATKLLLLAGQARWDQVAAVTAAGADGLLPRDSSSRQVANAVRAVVDGTPAIVMATKPPRPSHDPRMDLRVGTLSNRERELLGLLANGWSNRRIAEECFSTPSAPTCRASWSSWASTPSWRQSPSPTSTAWCRSGTGMSGTVTAPEGHGVGWMTAELATQVRRRHADRAADALHRAACCVAGPGRAYPPG